MQSRLGYNSPLPRGIQQKLSIRIKDNKLDSLLTINNSPRDKGETLLKKKSAPFLKPSSKELRIEALKQKQKEEDIKKFLEKEEKKDDKIRSTWWVDTKNSKFMNWFKSSEQRASRLNRL